MRRIAATSQEPNRGNFSSLMHRACHGARTDVLISRPVAPRLRQSGKKRFSGSPTIAFGNARLRKALWMPILTAVRCNPWLRQYYERLRAAGKPGKVALIAAMRKLLAAVWSVATHRRPFVPRLPAVPTGVGRELAVTPHVAQNWRRPQGSAIDRRTTRWPGYALSQRVRKRIEEIFGWDKTVGNFRKTRFIGRLKTQMWAYFEGAAYNLIRIAKLCPT